MAVTYRIVGPESLYYMSHRFANPKPIDTPEDYESWHAKTIAAGGEIHESEEGITAFVNQGRWMADCFWCMNSCLTRPDWGVAFCAECGAKYGQGKVTFPEDHEEATKILLERPMTNRNWTGETLEALRQENKDNL